MSTGYGRHDHTHNPLNQLERDREFNVIPAFCATPSRTLREALLRGQPVKGADAVLSDRRGAAGFTEAIYA